MLWPVVSQRLGHWEGNHGFCFSAELHQCPGLTPEPSWLNSKVQLVYATLEFILGHEHQLSCKDLLSACYVPNTLLESKNTTVNNNNNKNHTSQDINPQEVKNISPPFPPKDLGKKKVLYTLLTVI